MSLFYIEKRGGGNGPVSPENPLPVAPAEGARWTVGGRTWDTGWITVPGIVAGAAYASGDAVGTRFAVPVGASSGFVQAVSVFDLDKESLAFDVFLFTEPFTPTADNAAMDVADDDRHKFLGHVGVTAADYAALNDSSVATVANVNLPFVLPGTQVLHAQLVTRGTPNYAGSQDLSVRFLVQRD